ncbi:MAG: N-acetyltransferase family protein [Eubacteriales bacterium]
MEIRVATVADCAAMLEIYRPYIEETTVSFEYEVPSLDEFTDRLTAIQSHGFPWLVAVEDGVVLGYAYASPFHSRTAYRWTADVTIYLHRDSRGKGLGHLLYEKLFAILADLGYRSIYAIVTGQNDVSLRFHKKLGFDTDLVFPQAGYKHGLWLDVHYLCKFLNDETIVKNGFPKSF